MLRLILEFDFDGLSQAQKEGVLATVVEYADGVAFDYGAELVGDYTDDEDNNPYEREEALVYFNGEEE